MEENDSNPSVVFSKFETDIIKGDLINGLIRIEGRYLHLFANQKNAKVIQCEKLPLEYTVLENAHIVNKQVKINDDWIDIENYYEGCFFLEISKYKYGKLEIFAPKIINVVKKNIGYEVEIEYKFFFKKLIFRDIKKQKHKKINSFFTYLKQGPIFSKNFENNCIKKNTFYSLKKTEFSPKTNGEMLFKFDRFQSEMKTTFFDLFVCFDIETVVDRSNGNILKGYLANFRYCSKTLWAYDLIQQFKEIYPLDGDIKDFNFSRECYSFLLSLLREWGSFESIKNYGENDFFSSYIYDDFDYKYDEETLECSLPSMNVKMLLFGFNNSRFDNNFIIDAFIENGWKIDYVDRGGKVTKTILKLNNYEIVIYDIICWFPGVSLKEASSDCLDVGKLEFDILKYNEILLLCIQDTEYLTILPFS